MTRRLFQSPIQDWVDPIPHHGVETGTRLQIQSPVIYNQHTLTRSVMCVPPFTPRALFETPAPGYRPKNLVPTQEYPVTRRDEGGIIRVPDGKQSYKKGGQTHNIEGMKSGQLLYCCGGIWSS